MRVSDSSLQELSLRNLTARRKSYADAQRVASSGVRVEKPSDDPIAASRARGLVSRQRRAEAAARVAAQAYDELDAVDGALADADDVISRVRELAVQGASDTMSAADRTLVATEVAALRDQLHSLANTQIDGRYVFGGLATDRAPFDAAGNFVGSTTRIELELGPGVRVPAQVSGQTYFAGTFATIDALDAALRANDGPTVRSLLPDLNTAVGQLASARTEAGTLQQSMEVARSAAERVSDDARARHASAVEADPFSAASELARAELALQQAVAIAARLPPPSLLGGNT